MPTDVIMPQMGESIFEGTLTKWLKKPGDKVSRDEPLFEISTDKVDAEIPSPAAGVLVEQKVAEGTTVQVNTVVGVIDAEGAAPSAPAKPAAAPAAQAPAPAAPAPASKPSPVGETEIDTKRGSAVVDKQPGGTTAVQPTTQPSAPAGDGSRSEVRSSPLVRKIAKDKNIDLRQVSGTGMSGRITKDDILNFVDTHGAGAAAPARPSAPASAPAPTYAPATVSAPAAPMVPAAHALSGDLVPMSKMRSIIAQRMVESKHTSAHVHTVFKVDMTRIVKIREKQKASF
ncbi:MAG: putative dihydrolipoamide acetyltransferase, partial [Acidobacteriaceae bacterium]|nr:putative dihydrolipoamide acetyltransferase [Acidobacteriaceae bacterium]